MTGGPEDPAAKAYSWDPAPPRRSRLRDIRVGFVLEDDSAPVTSDIAKMLSELIDGIDRAGATVVEGWPDGIDSVAQTETFGYHIGVFLAHQQPGAELPDPSRLVWQQHARMAARAAWGRHFGVVDVFLSPANFTPAIPHDARPFEQRTIGLQIVGPRHEERLHRFRTHPAPYTVPKGGRTTPFVCREVTIRGFVVAARRYEQRFYQGLTPHGYRTNRTRHAAHQEPIRFDIGTQLNRQSRVS